MATHTIPAALAAFDTLPDAALIDVRVVAALLGCSNNTVWRRVRGGALPLPVRPSVQQTRWRVGDVRKVLAAMGGVQA